MPRLVLGSTLVPGIRDQLAAHLPDWDVVAVDLGTRDRPPASIESVRGELQRADVVMPLRGLVDERVITASPNCRIIQQFGAGVDTVDLNAARNRRIPVCNVPSRLGGNADSVAEMALFLMIGIGRDYPHLRRLVQSGDFSAPFGTSLYEKTVCIVGYGNIGQRLGRLLRPFHCRVIGIRRSVTRLAAGRGRVEVWAVDRLAEALSVADFVAVTIPLNHSTEGIIGPHQFASMKRGVRLINVSRGGTVDRASLMDALASGHVVGAGLDVFWAEPVDPHDPIFDYSVLATPHCGGLTDHMLEGTSRIATENIRRVMSGRGPRYRVDLNRT